jgi:hypothetical protein
MYQLCVAIISHKISFNKLLSTFLRSEFISMRIIIPILGQKYHKKQPIFSFIMYFQRSY